MATYYVSKTSGNDGNAGTSAGAAWATITRALDSAAAGTKIAAGDVVLVERENYIEDPVIDTVGTVGATIVVRGMETGFTEPADGVQPVTITGQVTTSLGGGSTAYYRFENIQQTGASGTGWALGNLQFCTWVNCSALSNSGASSDGWAARSFGRWFGCTASNNGRDGWNTLDSSAEDTVWNNCVAIGNGRYGFHSYTNGVQFDNCIAHANTTTGFYSGVMPPTGYSLHNCTADGSATGIRAGGRGASVVNCIISNNTTGWTGYTTDTYNCVARNNLYYNNGTDRSNAPAGIGDITGSDPLFTNYAGDDLTLAAGSPAIAAGYPAYLDIGARQARVEGGGGVVGII